MRESPSRKDLGSYYTPPEVVRTLVSWATEEDSDGPVLDPSCGDGRFLAGLRDAVGVDIDPAAAAEASRRTQAETVTADFFAWAAGTDRRFTAVVGNPPFIRYQRSAVAGGDERWSSVRPMGSGSPGCVPRGRRSSLGPPASWCREDAWRS